MAITASQRLTLNYIRRARAAFPGNDVPTYVAICFEAFAAQALTEAELSPRELRQAVEEIGSGNGCAHGEDIVMGVSGSILDVQYAVYREIAEVLEGMDGPHSPGAVRFIENVRRYGIGGVPGWLAEGIHGGL